eukprot:1159163-Pelagomonas_calceolata.AAC.8
MDEGIIAGRQTVRAGHACCVIAEFAQNGATCEAPAGMYLHGSFSHVPDPELQHRVMIEAVVRVRGRTLKCGRRKKGQHQPKGHVQ